MIESTRTDQHAYISHLFTGIDLLDVDFRNILLVIPCLQKLVLYAILKNQLDPVQFVKVPVQVGLIQ